MYFWHYMLYTFLHKEKTIFFQTVFFLICKMYTFDQSRTQQNSRLFFSSTICAMASYKCTKLTDLSVYVFCYNLRTWKYANVQIKLKMLVKVFNLIFFRKKRARWPTVLLPCCIQHYISC